MKKEILDALKTTHVPIKGHKGYLISKSGEVISKRGTAMAQTTDKFGYRTVTLCEDGKPRHHFVHRLVAETFIDNPESKRTVNHINGIRHDNRVENLEWATQGENNLHAYRHGAAAAKRCNGEKNGRSKISNAEAQSIRERLAKGEAMVAIAKEFGVAPTTIGSIKNGKSFKTI